MTLNTLKSAIMFSKSPLVIHVFADNENRRALRGVFATWPNSVMQRVKIVLNSVTFPGRIADEWQRLFKPCSSQRLFLPSLLKDVDATLYVDTDVVFLRPLEELWSYFEAMNASQIAALSPEHEDYAMGWYNRFAHHPYYPPLGVNSGVMLMNLTRMRNVQWESYMEPIFTEFKTKIVWGDQDIINVYFHYHPEQLFVFPCEWNYRADHCMYTEVCHTATKRGIGALHGSRGVFTNGKQPAFAAVYALFRQYRWRSEMRSGFWRPLLRSLNATRSTLCGRSMYTTLKRYVAKNANTWNFSVS